MANNNYSTNIFQLQQLINQTIKDIELGEEMIAATQSDQIRVELEAKNDRRKEMLCSLRDAMLEDSQIRRDIY